MFTLNNIAFDLSGNDFLEPYIRREIAVADPPVDTVDCAVKVITDETEGRADAEFERLTSEQRLPVAVLRCPNIVGTGMTGLMLRIAAGIYKGTFVHIADNQARVSVVHAVDVARAANIAAGIQGTYTLTDGVDPTYHDLADALAYRLGNKRIIILKPRWAKLWYGSSYYHTLTTDSIAQSTFTEIFPDFHPVSVTNYLQTHVYDQQSL